MILMDSLDVHICVCNLLKAQSPSVMTLVRMVQALNLSLAQIEQEHNHNGII